MRAQPTRHKKLLIAAVTSLSLAAASATTLELASSATGDNLNQLQSQLGANNAQQQSLSTSLATINSQTSALDKQISLVQSRQASVETALEGAEAKVRTEQAALAHERSVETSMRHRMKRAERILAAELVSRYEQPQQSVVTVLINSNGFQQMLDSLQYLRRANAEEQQIISITRAAKNEAKASAGRLQTLENAAKTAAAQQETQARALAGMQTLLNSQHAALAHDEAARSAALAAAKAKGASLQSAIAHVKAEELAAEEAAQQVTPTSGGGSTTDAGIGDAYDGWAIPYAIVLCESGGQNLPPNGAGASGYYQIIPSTWSDFGGTGPAAYLASRAEQDAIASKIWNGGAGASNWVCSGITGIT